MVQRPTARRQQGGFTLLLAMGIVTMVTLAVLLSYGMVSREAEVQGDGRRYKEAYFAAQAGLAEAREAMRIRLGVDETYTPAIQAMLALQVSEPGLNGGARPYFEVLPGPGGAGTWNSLAINEADLAPAERQSPSGEDYAAYPRQENVRYRVFLRDDEDGDPSGALDDNKQVWLIAIGEVVGPEGSRPTRAVIQALITNENAPAVTSPGTVMTGGGSDNTYSTTADAPDDFTDVATLSSAP
ncbi:type II secretion system protein [Myxococcus sp. AM001]|nr:type II secretion system protein [Myxococcus sp. AM001]